MAKKPPRRVTFWGRKKDPDEDFNKPPPSKADALKQCARIKKKIQDAPKKVWDKAFKFFEDIDQKASEIADSIKSNGSVSEGQKKALDGWERGVDKWIANNKPAEPAEGDEDGEDDDEEGDEE